MASLKLGQQVQVNKVMWANGPGLAPTKFWMSGYTLEGIVGGIAVVKAKKGLFSGCLVNYDVADVRAEKKVRNEAARTKGEARKNLMLMCMKSEYYVEGTGHRPPGEEIWIDKHSLGYGGGTWVVIEPGESYFWYVKNNGADGDDWSRNNVSTGGAGAIGYRLPMTDEARVLIDVAKES